MYLDHVQLQASESENLNHGNLDYIKNLSYETSTSITLSITRIWSKINYVTLNTKISITKNLSHETLTSRTITARALTIQ